MASHSTNDALLLPDEAPDLRCISKLLGITMLQLWEVFVKCKLSKKKGQFHMIIDQELEDCMQRIGLIGFLVLGESNKRKQNRTADCICLNCCCLSFPSMWLVCLEKVASSSCLSMQLISLADAVASSSYLQLVQTHA